jgi:capsular polysaccharide biosynthesis protein
MKEQNVQQADISLPLGQAERPATTLPDIDPEMFFLTELSLLRTIPAIMDESLGLLDRLKASWFGRFYQRYIKPYPRLRAFFIFMWRHGYPLYARLSMLRKPCYPLVRLRTVAEHQPRNIYALSPPQEVETPVPETFPAHERDHLVSPHDSYRFAGIYVAELAEATLYGGTNLVWKDENVICHDLYDFSRDYTSEELHGRNIILPKTQRIKSHYYNNTPASISRAATFVDACATNYAHWLTEVLPRIAMFCAQERYADIPLVIDAGLHRNMLASLALVAGPSREIIALPVGRALRVETLYVTSCTGYVPFDRRKKCLDGHSHGLFSPEALRVMRERIARALAPMENTSWPEKIYLKRNSKGRNLVNGEEIEEFLNARGYVTIQPETLSFPQQYYLFGNAKKIIGASGAAMANLIFAQNDADILVIMGKIPEHIYWYWQNLACANGKKVRYILGEPLSAKRDGIHSDVFVDLDMLRGEASGIF